MSARSILTTTPGLATEVVSVRPVVLPAPARGDDLEVRVSAPTTGEGLPVLLLAHGFGGSMRSYDPLVDHWTAAGFVVVQPTFLDSRTLGVGPQDPRYPDVWRTRVEDLVRVLDDLDVVLAAVGGLPERVDADRLAVAGHSWGGQSVGMLLGARVVGSDGLPGDSAADARVRAGVLLATTGTGGADLSPFAAEHFPFMSPDFSQLRTPTLVVAGDADSSALSTRGPDWFTDVHRLSPGSQALVTLTGGEHSLGGIHGYGASDTTDESPARVDLVRRSTTAFLCTALGLDPRAFDDLVAGAAAGGEPAGRVDLR